MKWPAANPGDLLWCHYPEARAGRLVPGPKPRPALVMRVWDEENPPRVAVACGTSKRVMELHRGEFHVLPADGTAFAATGLRYPTKFNLARVVTLPYAAPWFEAMPKSSTPRMGAVTQALKARIVAAFREAQ